MEENKIQEKRINISKSDFIKELEKDSELNIFLHLPLKKLPSEYKYLVEEELPYGDGTLYQLIDMSFASLGDDKNFFSVKDSKITGWMAYKTDKADTYVENIKMCSLTPNENNIELIKDLKNFLDFLLIKYNLICWYASQENDVGNKIYDKVIKTYGGKKEVVNSKLFHYVIKKQ